jgi:hypothetical protein
MNMEAVVEWIKKSGKANPTILVLISVAIRPNIIQTIMGKGLSSQDTS